MLFKEEYHLQMKQQGITDKFALRVRVKYYSDLKALGIDDVVYKLKLFHVIKHGSWWRATNNYEDKLLRLWLRHEIKLEIPLYYDLLTFLGYKDLEAISMMNDEEFDKLTFRTPVDRQRMKDGIEKLKAYYNISK